MSEYTASLLATEVERWGNRTLCAIEEGDAETAFFTARTAAGYGMLVIGQRRVCSACDAPFTGPALMCQCQFQES
jgi:hypothetical protein